MIDSPDKKNSMESKFEATSITATFGLKQKIVSQMIDNEDFRKVNVGLLTIFESENWMYIQKTYIPKNLVSHLYVFNTGWIEAARIYLLNGSYLKLNYSEKYGKVLSKMLPNAFIVKTDRMELLDVDENMNLLNVELEKYNLSIENVIINRPDFLNQFSKDLVRRSEYAFEKTLEGKSKISKFLLSKLS